MPNLGATPKDIKDITASFCRVLKVRKTAVHCSGCVMRVNMPIVDQSMTPAARPAQPRSRITPNPEA